MLKQTQPSFRYLYLHCYSYTIIIFMTLTLLIKGPTSIDALLISEDVSSNSKLAELSVNSTITEENLVLTDGQGIKLKEIRKLARLAGHEQPEGITEVDSQVCYKDDCLKAAKEFFISMDFSLDPCMDWKKYSCEWRTLSSKTAIDQQTALSMKVENQVKEILHDVDLEKPTVKLAQLYYNSCKAWFEDISKIDHIKSYIDKLGSWPLLSGKTGGEGEWSKVLSEILRIGPDNVTPFLLRLESNEVDGNHRVLLQIDSGSTQLDLDSDDVHDLLQLLRKKPPTSRQVEAAAIRELKVSMKALSALAFDAGSSKNSKVMTLKDIQERLSKDVPNLTMDIQNLIQSTFHGTDLKIIPETEVLTDYESLVEYVKTVNSLNSTTILNMVFLQLALILIGDSTNVIEDNNFFHMDNYKRFKLSRSPSLHCLKETTEVFPYAISEEYISRHPSTLESRQLVNRIVGHLKNGFMEIISSILWLDGKAKDIVRDKITKTEVLVAYPDWIETELFELYHKNINFKESFNSSGIYLSFRVTALSWLNGKYWKTKLHDEKLNGWNYVERNGFVGETAVEYIHSLNQIRIPTGILQPPMFSTDFPGYMNFGGLGSVVARELSRIFDPNGIYTNSQGEYGSWFDDKTYKSYMDWAMRIQNDWEGDDISLDSKITNVLAYHITVKGYQEYLKSLKTDGKEEVKLPGLSKLEPEKLLYLKLTNVLCESSQIKRLRMDVNSDQHLTYDSDAIYPASRTSHFSKLFGCEMDYANSALDMF